LYYGAVIFGVEEITFWHTYSTNSGEYKLLTEKIIPEFERLHPNIRVVETQVNYDDMRQRLIVSTATGELADVIRMDIIWVPQFGDIEVLLPLNKRLSRRSSTPSRTSSFPVRFLPVFGKVTTMGCP